MLAYFKSLVSRELTPKEKAFRLIQIKFRENRLSDFEKKSLQEFKVFNDILERILIAFANQIDDFDSPLLCKLPNEVSHGILKQLTEGIKNFIQAYQNFCLYGHPEQTDLRNALKAYAIQMVSMHRSYTLTLLGFTDLPHNQSKGRLFACLDSARSTEEIMADNELNHSKISAWLSVNKSEYSLVAKVNELIKTQDELLKNVEGNLIPHSPWSASIEPTQEPRSGYLSRAK
jgi:hypothetical protein